MVSKDRHLWSKLKNLIQLYCITVKEYHAMYSFEQIGQSSYNILNKRNGSLPKTSRTLPSSGHLGWNNTLWPLSCISKMMIQNVSFTKSVCSSHISKGYQECIPQSYCLEQGYVLSGAKVSAL